MFMKCANILDVAINKHSFKEAFMVNNLSITRNGDEEVTITLPLINKNENAALVKLEYDNFVRRMTQNIAVVGIHNDLTLLLYKIEAQGIIVFNLKGKEEGIDKLIENFKSQK